MVQAPSGGMLTTAGGLVFTGDSFGYLIALDAENGQAGVAVSDRRLDCGAPSELRDRRQAVPRGGGRIRADGFCAVVILGAAFGSTRDIIREWLSGPSRSPIRESSVRTPRRRRVQGRFHNRAKAVLPDGVTHVGRFLEPHPIYVERAAGSRKVGRGRQRVRRLSRRTRRAHPRPQPSRSCGSRHRAGSKRRRITAPATPLEVEWAEQVQRMIPSAERVRFTVTGTEATHLALRVARAFTGKHKIIRFAGHFHGWHDHVCFPPGGAPGIIAGIVEDTLVAPPNDLAQVEQWLASRDDIAALILEPTGATFGKYPEPGNAAASARPDHALWSAPDFRRSGIRLSAVRRVAPSSSTA